ncbi:MULTISPECIES: SEC10/PgrA surface exclusion domain-containing protein [Lactobacillus]|uniref:SEC10/PgrA surface exclusion domain-containing protein n=1 Tax=Lactobacillus xujianguonis TaxID=2495899 RepID=A0A437SVD7_9LACO|nr:MULTISPECIES: SEC10/PgrA surface exclusion domain-containing protein [Lactobacillus]RVU70807.1 SEC10/PgrA surface exclusion domain-containing protein [Lactobacillus xujianguonis]RVU77001.1 SEC10/PgrA surface exclusion domain-containing protein [Lactobacillus xujianguonis]
MHCKKIIATLLAGVTLAVSTASLTNSAQPTTVQAATKNYVVVKGNKKVRLYKANGKKAKTYASPKRTYSFSKQKHLKVGKKKYLAYKIGNNSQWLLAKNASLVKKAKYQTAKITLPKGYTRAAVLKAYQGKPSSSFITACMKGMDQNSFSRGLNAESSQDNQTMIDLANLTSSQSAELTSYALRLINGVRSQLNLPAWQASTGTQKLANDIAKEYAQNGRGINNGDHYVAGIVRACKANGLNLNDNYVEDMAGYRAKNGKISMTAMKKNIYFGLKQMLFGYVGQGEAGRKTRSNYREWEHAGDLLNTQGSKKTDGQSNYFGFSVSKVGNVYSMHYISVPTYIVNHKEYNQGFRP